MEKYEVVGLLGEGSFGRVYKAKQISDSKTVALKIISKRGRSVKEIKGLRRECDIQRHLHHPNIIQMLDSFETENEIVVITEFAHKELTVILGKEGYLSEERVQKIVWDLVSALYYLHSHRVLHRDLKPQNILLDAKNTAKLCDFGFARNMSTGTHVLTSIKGTPLYMAPELIEEHPYDHSADLWSLGCIIYELLIGAPPFCTSSILHLIRMIRHEQIQWPTFLSEHCISFLKGLLHKNPHNRMTWPEILKHPFVEGHILIVEDMPVHPLTRPMSVNTLQAKEQQRKDRLSQKTKGKSSESSENQSKAQNLDITKGSNKNNKTNKSSGGESDNQNISDKLKKMSLGEKSKESNKSLNVSKRIVKQSSTTSNSEKEMLPNGKENHDTASQNSLNNEKNEKEARKNSSIKGNSSKNDVLNFYEDSQPIENEEWMVFLRKTMAEILSKEYTSLTEASLANVLVSPLRNTNTNSKVIASVATLFSIPLVVIQNMENVMSQIENVYNKIKLVPNLVYSTKIIFKQKDINGNSESGSLSSCDNANANCSTLKDLTDLTTDDFEALEYTYLLVCNLVHKNNQFLIQFCDSVVILNIYNLLQCILSQSDQSKLIADLVSIFTHVLRTLPENWEIIDKVFVEDEDRGVKKRDILQSLLLHSDALIRERACYFVYYLGKIATKTFTAVWCREKKEILEALMYDSMENVRNAAEVAVGVLKSLEVYNTSFTSDSVQSGNIT